MTLERLTLLLDVYGSRVERWPPADRRAAQALLQVSAAARARHAAAEQLDALLDRTVQPIPSAALRARVLATAPGHATTWPPAARRWPSRPVMVAAASGLAMAASLALWLVRTPAPTPAASLGGSALAQLGVFDVPTDVLLSDTELGFGDDTPAFGCDDPTLGCDESLGEPVERSGRLAGAKEMPA